MNRLKGLSAAVLALLLLAACGSMNNGSTYPTGSTYPAGTTYPNAVSEIRGTVDSVDLNSRSIYLSNVSNYSTNLYPNSGNNSSNVRVYYDDRTTVSWNGTNYRPTDLERGDQVSVRVDRSGNQLLAESMNVLYNARGSMASSSPTSPSSPYGVSSVHGTIRSIDTYGRTISVDPGYGSYMTVNYASNTPVYFNNRPYTISDLEVGDQIDLRVSDLGGGRFNAQDITVTRSVNGAGTSSSQYSTMRGTVRFVDPSTRTISIDSPTWMTGFQTNPGSAMVIQYDPNVQVNYQGQLHPVNNLEPGDVIDVQVQRLSGGNYLAQSITLVRDVNAR